MYVYRYKCLLKLQRKCEQNNLGGAKMLVNDSKIVSRMYVCTLYIRSSYFVCLNEPSTHTHFSLLYFQAYV